MHSPFQPIWKDKSNYHSCFNKPLLIMKLSILLCHYLDVYFRPYNDFLTYHMILESFIKKIPDSSTWISSLRLSCKKTILTSICSNTKLYCTIMVLLYFNNIFFIILHVLKREYEKNIFLDLIIYINGLELSRHDENLKKLPYCYPYVSTFQIVFYLRKKL